MSTVIKARAELMARMGMQYGDARDIFQALGYKKEGEIDYGDYMSKYLRQDIAKAVIDRPVSATWQGPFKIVEVPYAEKSALEKAWLELSDKLKLKTKFARLDKLSGIGEYGVLLFGLNDISSVEGLKGPVKKGKRELLYVKPFGQNKATVKQYVNETSDPRYGLPKVYELSMRGNNDGVNSERKIEVHHTRILHIIGESLESDVTGVPRLEAIFNRLTDLEKLIGGSAEMFWRGARPGYAGVLKDDYTMSDTLKKDLLEQIDEYEHDLRRILINEGVDLKALDMQIADPLNHVDIQIQMISAATGIPKRVLTGTERGELASTQDKTAWLEYVQIRREEYAEPVIVRPFVDRCIEFGILPKPEDIYGITWQDLFVLNEKARVDVGKGRASALREYLQNPMAESVIPVTAFVKFFLGLTDAEQDEMMELIDVSKIRELQEEGAVTEEEEDIINEE